MFWLAITMQELMRESKTKFYAIKLVVQVVKCQLESGLTCKI